MNTLLTILIHLMIGTTIVLGQQRDMESIIEALNKVDQIRQSSDDVLRPLFDLNTDQLSFDFISEYEPSPYHTSADFDSDLTSKSKRGWEDFPRSWRQAPKRAWDVVRKLWKRPDIRTQYMSYLNNGKRNGEVIAKTPVQQNDVNPNLSWNDISYDTDSKLEMPTGADFDSDVFDPFVLQKPATKRGWEDIGMFKVGKRRLQEFDESLLETNDYKKRGWEDLIWKRNDGVQPLKDNTDNTKVLSEIENSRIRMVDLPSEVDILPDQMRLDNTDTQDEELLFPADSIIDAQ